MKVAGFLLRLSVPEKFSSHEVFFFLSVSGVALDAISFMAGKVLLNYFIAKAAFIYLVVLYAFTEWV